MVAKVTHFAPILQLLFNRKMTMQLFELISVRIVGNKNADGEYETYEQNLGIFDSVASAERFLQIFINKEICNPHYYYDKYFCFFIYEKTLNDGLRPDWQEIAEFQAVWSYLSDGTFFCHGYCDDTCTKPFKGRPADEIPLCVGELGWMYTRGRIAPCLVGILPMTDVEYQKREANLGHSLGLDYVDDAYLVYEYSFHEHPQTWQVFPYFGRISKRNLNRLQRSRQWHLDGCPGRHP